MECTIRGTTSTGQFGQTFLVWPTVVWPNLVCQTSSGQLATTLILAIFVLVNLMWPQLGITSEMVFVSQGGKSRENLLRFNRVIWEQGTTVGKNDMSKLLISEVPTF